MLSAILLLTSCFGCVSVAYADGFGNTVTYMLVIDPDNGGTYSTHDTQTNVSVGQWLQFPQTGDSPWFRFDGWYYDAARTKKASLMLTTDSDLTLYAAYVFKLGMGDVNGDGIVNTDDITLFRRYLVDGKKNIEYVSKGSEWDVARPGGTYDDGKTYFVERVATLNGSGAKSIRNVASIRAALTDGYGIDVYNGKIFQSQTVYFHNADNWSAPHVYVWNSVGELYSWPGIAMTDLKNGWWSAKIPSVSPNIIFNDDGTTQTADLTFNADTPYYAYDSWYSSYPTTKTIYFFNRHNWVQPLAYNWTEGVAASWPGPEMTQVTTPGFSNWWYVEMPVEREKIIFHDNSGADATLDYAHKTYDLTLDDGKPYFYMGEWKDSLTTTVYYYNEALSGALAYYWGNGSNNWPGTQMKAVRGAPGLFSIEVPLEMTKIQFNGGNDSTKYADNLLINRTNPYYSQYGDWYGENGRFVQVTVGDVTYNMIPCVNEKDNNAFTRDDGQYMLLKLYLKAEQEVQVYRFGAKSNFDSNFGFTGKVSQTGYYDFYCKNNGTCWVNRG